MKGQWLVNPSLATAPGGQFEVADAPVIVRAAASAPYNLQVRVDDEHWQNVMYAGAPIQFGLGGDTLRVIATAGIYRVVSGAQAPGDRIWVEHLTPDEARWFMEADLTSVAPMMAQYVSISGAVTVTWEGIANGPSSTATDVDDAVAKRHQHGASLEDIDDAAAKRHQHGASLEDIDDAVAKRHTHSDLPALEASVALAHQHGASLGDIDDAAAKRHQHGASLADIDDAAAKRHQHGAPLADIDDAAAKRHEHPNLTLLHSIANHDWRGGDVDASVLRSVTLDARPVPQILDGLQSVVIMVAPDTASRQPGDWDKVGWEGVKTAFQAAHGFQQTNGQFVVIRLRPGVYVADSVLTTGATGGARIRIEAEQGPTLPDPSSWSFYNGGTPDRAADIATLEALYPVRIEHASWTMLWAYEGATVYFKNILFKGTNAASICIRARGQTYVYVSRCSAINCNQAINADCGALVRWDGGVVFPRDTGNIANAATQAVIQISSYPGNRFVAGHCRWGPHGNTGGAVQIWSPSSSDAAVLGAIARSVGHAYTGGSLQMTYVELHQAGQSTGYDTFYATEGSLVLARNVVFKANQGQAMHVIRGSFGYMNHCELDAAGTALARTLRAGSGGVLWSNGLTGGAPVYQPAKGSMTATGGTNV